MTNLVILVGRIARDPETRTTQGGTSITSISVVTDRPARKDGKTYKDENGYTAKDSEFHRITCFNGLGQNVAKYCTKGQLVTVEGRNGLVGMTMSELSQFMYELGCKTAYNLDGGATAQMAVNGKIYSESSGDRGVTDIVYIGLE